MKRRVIRGRYGLRWVGGWKEGGIKERWEGRRMAKIGWRKVRHSSGLKKVRKKGKKERMECKCEDADRKEGMKEKRY